MLHRISNKTLNTTFAVTILIFLLFITKSAFAACTDEGAGNTKEAATNLSLPAAKTGAICPGTTADWYKFSIPKGTTTTIVLKNLTANLDFVLWDPTGTTAIYNPGATGTLEERILFLTTYDSYILEVVESTYGTGAVTGSYRLEINFTAPPPPPTGTCSSNAECENDGNKCTIDTCVSSSCKRETKTCPPATNACRSSSCNPATGACEERVNPVNGVYTCTSWTGCQKNCDAEGRPKPSARTCLTSTCSATCGGICPGTNPAGQSSSCTPDCPFTYPDPAIQDYRKFCQAEDWYAGDPHPLAIICVIVRLLNIFLLSVGAIFVMYVFMSAIKFAMAQGDPKALQGAKQSLTVAIIGMLIVAGVFTILTILRNVLGLQYQLLTNPFDVLSKNLADLLLKLNIYVK